MENEAIHVLLTRRSIRKFKPEQIKDEELQTVLKVGTYAPTAMGMQSPLIVAVQNKEDVAILNKLSAQIMGRDVLPYYGAPTIIIVFYTEIAKSDYFGVLDASAVCTNMLNAAHAIGLGSCWIHRSKEIFDSPQGLTLLKKWGINEKVVGVASIALGYADQEAPAPKPRREGYTRVIK